MACPTELRTLAAEVARDQRSQSDPRDSPRYGIDLDPETRHRVAVDDIDRAHPKTNDRARTHEERLIHQGETWRPKNETSRLAHARVEAHSSQIRPTQAQAQVALLKGTAINAAPRGR